MKHKTVVVTGASKGIGRASSLKLASDGYDLVVTDILDLSGTVADIRKTGVTVNGVRGDISNPATIEKIGKKIDETDSKVIGLVNSAFSMASKPFLRLNDDDWDHTFNVSFFATVKLCRKVIPMMLKVGGGSIVNISSVHALAAGDVNSAAYDAAKAAMNALTRSLAMEFGPENIRVNSILPGLVTSERIIEWKREDPLGFSASESTHALRRAGTPEEIAEAVSFLISERSSFITGSSMLVDGGQMASINETAALNIVRNSALLGGRNARNHSGKRR